MNMLSFIDAIPARTTVCRGESLNLLGGVANGGAARTLDIGVWANDGRGWKRLMTERVYLDAGEHRHLYFTLGPEAFTAAIWGEAPDELELAIRDTEPPGNGVAVFVED